MEAFAPVPKYFLKFLSVILLAFLVSCDSGGGGGDGNKSASKDSVTGDITLQSGGTVTLPQVGTATFAPGALEAATTASLSKVSNAVTVDAFADSAIMFDSKVKTSYELEIQLGPDQPQKDVTVQLIVPDDLRTVATASDELRLMYLNNWQDDEEVLNTVELIDTRDTVSDASITGVLPREAFSLNPQGQYVAYVFLALMPTAPSNITTLKSSLQTLLMAMNPVGFAWATDGDNECNGALLRPVDDRFPITSPFGPRNVKGNPKASKNHSGIDYGVPEGTEVRAAADGFVDEIRIKTADGTYGYHIVLSHPGVGKTLYAHLSADSAKLPKAVKAGDPIKAGDVIGVSGKTGTIKAHLHFEYAPLVKGVGDIFVKGNKRDPNLCMQAPGQNPDVPLALIAGLYEGGYESDNVRGELEFTVNANGVVTVTTPEMGTGTVNSTGSTINFSAENPFRSTVGGFTATFGGSIRIQAGSVSAEGIWTGIARGPNGTDGTASESVSANGTWRAVRVGGG